MPALTPRTANALLLIAIPTLAILSVPAVTLAAAAPAETPLSRALAWLAANQHPDGSYPGYPEITTPSAAYALWLNNSRSAKALLSFKWLASELDNSSSPIWLYPEADIPGQILFTLSLANDLSLLSNSSDYQALLSSQLSSGGFKGWYDPSGQVESSVDTSMSLLGLVNAKRIDSTSQQRAISYLLGLQNSNGSFNLTKTTQSSSLSSLGPDLDATTALVLLALSYSSVSAANQQVSKGLSFLTSAASGNFSGHIYAAAMSALAFNSYNRDADASRAISFLVAKQNSDGGFADSFRSQSSSTALDTGWAAVAMQVVQSRPLPVGFLQFLGRPIILLLIAGIVAVTVVAFLVVYIARRRASPRLQERPTS